MNKEILALEELKGIKKERKIKELTEEMIGNDLLLLFKISGAFWSYPENPEAPHALLSSGKHSDGYLDCSQVLKYPNLKRILVKRLIHNVLAPFEVYEYGSFFHEKLDYIVSSSMSAIPLGDAVATYLDSIFIYTEKVNGVQKLKRFEVPEGARILQVEELITTLKTTRQVTEAVLEKNKNVKFLRDKNGKIIVLTLVHRPEKLPMEYQEYRILPLIELEIHTWDPENCPLCRAGSNALKPKENWQLFLKYNKI